MLDGDGVLKDTFNGVLKEESLEKMLKDVPDDVLSGNGVLKDMLRVVRNDVLAGMFRKLLKKQRRC